MPTPAETFSPEFVRKLKDYDATAWRDAFDRLHSIALRGAAWANTRLSEQDREEVASDALVEIARQIGELDTWPQVTALTFVAAQRRSVDRLRRLRTQKRHAAGSTHLTLEEAPEGEMVTMAPSALGRWAEVSAIAERLIAGLGEPAATLVRGYVAEGLSYEELARRAHLPLGTAAAVIYRSMRRLERELGSSPKLAKELSLYLRLFLLT